MRHRILTGFLLLASSTAILASSTVNVGTISVSPPSLSFGNVGAGQAQTLLLTVKNEKALSFQGTATVTAPYTVTPSALSFTSGSSVSVIVSLPANATAGSHSGTVTITVPSAIAGGPATTINVPVTANVTAATGGTGIDLKVDPITIKSCAVNSQGTLRSCSFFVPLLTTGTTTSAKTTILEGRGSGPLTQTLDQPLVYNTPGAVPFIYAVSQLPLTTATVTIRIVVDSDSKVAESNEGNNTVTATFNVQ